MVLDLRSGRMIVGDRERLLPFDIVEEPLRGPGQAIAVRADF